MAGEERLEKSVGIESNKTTEKSGEVKKSDKTGDETEKHNSEVSGEIEVTQLTGKKSDMQNSKNDIDTSKRSSDVQQLAGAPKSRKNKDKKEDRMKKITKSIKPLKNSKLKQINPQNQNVSVTSEQAMKNLSSLKSMYDRNQARKEESEYLKLRKQQLLMDFLPKTKAARMRRSDEKFPSGALKAMEKWNFGAIKAKYMSLRPNGKYATWFGKNHDEKHKHEKCITIKERILVQRQQQTGMKGIGSQFSEPPKSIPPAPQSTSGTVETQKAQVVADGEDFDEDELITNVRFSRPLNDKGIPFWIEEADNADTEEEEVIVNSEAVQKDGQEALRKKKGDPRGGVAFNMMADIKELASFDNKFKQRDIYLFTIQNVVTLWGNKEDKPQLPDARLKKVIFNTSMICSEYEPGTENIVNKRGFKSTTKDFKDVVKAVDKD